MVLPKKVYVDRFLKSTEKFHLDRLFNINDLNYRNL